jgi:hypothetical protein
MLIQQLPKGFSQFGKVRRKTKDIQMGKILKLYLFTDK